MQQYTNNPLSATNHTNDVKNLIVLREDLHSIFDQRLFVFVPKGPAFYVHFLAPTKDPGPIYHNREVRSLESVVAPEFIFARFAWAIFHRSQEFTTRSRVPITVWDEGIEGWQRQTKDGKQWHIDQARNRKHTRAEGKGKGKAVTEDETYDKDLSSHSDSGSQPRDDFQSPSNSTDASSLGGPDPATRATAIAISPGTLAEIIRLSCAHPEVMSYLSEHNSEELAAEVGRFEAVSRIIRRCNIPIRKDDSL